MRLIDHSVHVFQDNSCGKNSEGYAIYTKVPLVDKGPIFGELRSVDSYLTEDGKLKNWFNSIRVEKKKSRDWHLTVYNEADFKGMEFPEEQLTSEIIDNDYECLSSSDVMKSI